MGLIGCFCGSIAAFWCLVGLLIVVVALTLSGLNEVEVLCRTPQVLEHARKQVHEVQCDRYLSPGDELAYWNCPIAVEGMRIYSYKSFPGLKWLTADSFKVTDIKAHLEVAMYQCIEKKTEKVLGFYKGKPVVDYEYEYEAKWSHEYADSSLFFGTRAAAKLKQGKEDEKRRESLRRQGLREVTKEEQEEQQRKAAEGKKKEGFNASENLPPPKEEEDPDKDLSPEGKVERYEKELMSKMDKKQKARYLEQSEKALKFKRVRAKNALYDSCGRDFERNPSWPTVASPSRGTVAFANQTRVVPALVGGTAFEVTRHAEEIHTPVPIPLPQRCPKCKHPFEIVATKEDAASERRWTKDDWELTMTEMMSKYGTVKGSEIWSKAKKKSAGIRVTDNSIYTCGYGPARIGCVRMSFWRSGATELSHIGQLAKGMGGPGKPWSPKDIPDVISEDSCNKTSKVRDGALRDLHKLLTGTLEDLAQTYFKDKPDVQTFILFKALPFLGEGYNYLKTEQKPKEFAKGVDITVAGKMSADELINRAGQLPPRFDELRRGALVILAVGFMIVLASLRIMSLSWLKCIPLVGSFCKYWRDAIVGAGPACIVLIPMLSGCLSISVVSFITGAGFSGVRPKVGLSHFGLSAMAGILALMVSSKSRARIVAAAATPKKVEAKED